LQSDVAEGYAQRPLARPPLQELANKSPLAVVQVHELGHATAFFLLGAAHSKRIVVRL